jgi:tellurite resistance-related uncharacterized protein
MQELLMETLTDAVERLRKAGFNRCLHAQRGAMLVCDCQAVLYPSEFQIAETVRFEGSSDPDDQDVAIAGITSCGHAGLFTAGYGPSAGDDESEVLRQLQSRPNHLPEIPGNTVYVRTSSLFTDKSAPGGLLRAHHLAEGVWGRIRVTQGTITFVFAYNPLNAIAISVGTQIDIPPSVLHQVSLPVGSAFMIDFYRVQ